MRLLIFWKNNCPYCPQAKQTGKKLEDKLDVEYHDVQTVDGLSLATQYNILSAPNMILLDKKNVVKQWTAQEIPQAEDVLGLIKEKEHIRRNKYARIGAGEIREKERTKEEYIEIKAVVDGKDFNFYLFRNRNKRDGRSDPDWSVSGKSSLLKPMQIELDGKERNPEYMHFGYAWNNRTSSNKSFITVNFHLKDKVVYIYLWPNEYRSCLNPQDYNASMDKELAECLGFESINRTLDDILPN